MGHYGYVPFLGLRKEYRCRRAIIGATKEVTELIPVVVVVVWRFY